MATSPAVTKAVKRFNPYALKLSSRVPPWATLHHVGRKSGREYRTPVVAFAARAPIDPATVTRPGAPVAIAEHRDVLVLHPLPWAADVDWCRNVRAAGSYTLTRKGVDYRVDQLRVVDADEARGMLGGFVGASSQLIGIEDFLVGRLRRAPGPA
ncbi:nitroreductase family deazaflavin-dependent oxidoreductase [Isoptericola hypogeus]|uniref:Nitroreductase family deazaflavin-dependent oxidoreductase n=1 Tax=Isoptericola hypogeus TaxID=300179 RepID=A0ABN2JHP7_9MICO